MLDLRLKQAGFDAFCVLRVGLIGIQCDRLDNVLEGRVGFKWSFRKLTDFRSMCAKLTAKLKSTKAIRFI